MTFFADAKKAFDYVNWKFMELLIKKLQLRVRFGNVVGAIYKNQTATLIINNEASNPITIEKGTRPGVYFWCWKLSNKFKKMRILKALNTKIIHINTWY